MSFSALLDATGWALLHFTWIGAVWGLFALAALMMLRGRTPGLRYSVCLLSFMSLPCLFGWLLWREFSSAAHQAINANSSGIQSVSQLTDEASGSLAGPLAATLSWAKPVVPYLPWIWLVGCMAVALRLPIGLWGLRSLRRSALTSPLPRAIVQAFDKAMADARIRVPVTLALSKQVTGAVTIGILRPVVLLPASLVAGMSPRELEMILIHELAHIRRFDNAVSLLQGIMESLFFFHPLVWCLSRRLRHERELCCDDAVVNTLGSPDIYARTLLRACDLSSGRNPSLAASLNGPRMVDRVRHLLNQENSRMCRTQRLFGSLLATVCLTVLLAGASAQQCNDKCCPGKKAAKKKPLYAVVVDSSGSPVYSITTSKTPPACQDSQKLQLSGKEWYVMKSPHGPHSNALLRTQDCSNCHKLPKAPKKVKKASPHKHYNQLLPRYLELKPGEHIVTTSPPILAQNSVMGMTAKAVATGSKVIHSDLIIATTPKQKKSNDGLTILSLSDHEHKKDSPPHGKAKGAKRHAKNVILARPSSDRNPGELEEELRRTRLEVQRLRADVQRLIKRYDGTKN